MHYSLLILLSLDIKISFLLHFKQNVKFLQKNYIEFWYSRKIILNYFFSMQEMLASRMTTSIREFRHKSTQICAKHDNKILKVWSGQILFRAQGSCCRNIGKEKYLLRNIWFFFFFSLILCRKGSINFFHSVCLTWFSYSKNVNLCN